VGVPHHSRALPWIWLWCLKRVNYKFFLLFQKSRHHRLQEIHGSNTQVSVTDGGTLPLPTIKPGDEYLQESDIDVEDDSGDDDDDDDDESRDDDDDDGDENDEEGEESAEVLEKQSKYL